MKIAFLAASFLPVLLLHSSTPAMAFDCARASTTIERAICADATLKAADDAMSAAYGELRKNAQGVHESSMLKLAQKRWIATREDSCGSETGKELVSCLIAATNERLLLFEGKPESGPGAGVPFMPVFIQQEGGTGLYDVDYTLLRFVDPETPGQKLFNRELKRIGDKAPLGKQHQQAMEGMELSATATAKLSYASPSIVSSAIDIWSFDGGAHGNGGTTNVNVDLGNGRLLTFADLFDPADKESLVDSCRKQIRDQKVDKLGGEEFKPEDDPNYQDSTIGEHVGDLTRWTFNADTAVVTFDAYAIGSYAEGPYECTYAMGLLRSLSHEPSLLPE